jgi:hypothetical protein
MEVLFAIKSRLFAVFRDADGSITWSDYDGQKVKAAFPSSDGMRCNILLDPDATRKPRFENLFCVDRDGKTVWIATLPLTDDTFVGAEMGPDGLRAWSWSCYRIIFDPADGRIIEQVFTK